MKLYYVMHEIAEGFEDWYVLDTGLVVIEMFGDGHRASCYHSMDDYKKSFTTEEWKNNTVLVQVT